ncbi:MAG: DNA (cytosine-5-)-methyltransferase [Methylococcaceae bacterium]
MNNIEAVDLFCGVGGLTHGLEKSGIRVVAGYDIDSACRYPYHKNNSAKFIEKDIAEIKGTEISTHYSDNVIKILAGCAPCQPFSKYTQHLPKDARWSLLYSFARLIKETSPHLITMENVPEIKNHSVYHDFEEMLSDQGYFIFSQIVFCPDYGIPQKRKRLVLLASKFSTISLLEPTHDESTYVSVRDTIAELPEIQAGQKNSFDPYINQIV